MQYTQTNSFLAETNRGFQGKFQDKHSEKNAGEIMHMVRRNDVYANIGWMTDLRGDRIARLANSTNSNTTGKKIRIRQQEPGGVSRFFWFYKGKRGGEITIRKLSSLVEDVR